MRPESSSQVSTKLTALIPSVLHRCTHEQRLTASLPAASLNPRTHPLSQFSQVSNVILSAMYERSSAKRSESVGRTFEFLPHESRAYSIAARSEERRVGNESR